MIDNYVIESVDYMLPPDIEVYEYEIYYNEEEIWRDIYFIDNGVEYDYRGLYQVSNKGGRVKSLNYNHTGKERILKAVKKKYGYEQVGLQKNSKRKFFLIHRLVAHMFVENDNPIEKIKVNHIDENKENNNAENLEWCTVAYNNNYGTRNERASESMKGKNKGEKAPRARKVILVDPITKQIVFTFLYVKQATDFYDIGRMTLDWYLKGKSKKGHEYNGFLFYYEEDYKQMKEDD